MDSIVEVALLLSLRTVYSPVLSGVLNYIDPSVSGSYLLLNKHVNSHGFFVSCTDLAFISGSYEQTITSHWKFIHHGGMDQVIIAA